MKGPASILCCALAVWATSATAFALGPEKVKDQSFRDAEGHRVLQESMVIDAPVTKVWQAFTTDAGFTRWAVPVAHITPGNGGLIEFAMTAMPRTSWLWPRTSVVVEGRKWE